MKQPLQYAKTKEGLWIDVRTANKEDCYFCPICQKKVRVRKTKFGPCFYHVPEKKNTKKGGEGRLHKQTKTKIKNWGIAHGYFVEEEWIVEQRRGDLFFPPNIIIEVQCSPLSAKVLEKRHQDYQKEGYRDLWLLGPKYRTYTQWYPFLRYHPNYGFYVLRFDAQQFYLQSHLEFAPGVFYQVPITIDEFLAKKKGQEIPFSISKEQQKKAKRIQAWFHRSTKEVQTLAYVLYEHHTSWQEELDYLSMPLPIPFYSLTEELYWKVEQKVQKPLMNYTPTPFLNAKKLALLLKNNGNK